MGRSIFAHGFVGALVGRPSAPMSRFANSRIHQPVDNSLHRLSPGGVYVDLSESTKQRERSNKLLALHERASTSYLARRAHKQGRHRPVDHFTVSPHIKLATFLLYANETAN